MRVKVVKRFKDKVTGTLHKPNEIIDVTKGRYEEINSTAFGILVEEEKKDPVKPKPNSAKKRSR